MIRRKGQYKRETKEKMRGGEGVVHIERFWESEKELKAKNRLFAKLIIPKGSGIGFHQHDNEEEVFIVISGVAQADDNGQIVTLYPGDTILTGGGAGHAIKSVGDEDLELIAVINCY